MLLRPQDDIPGLHVLLVDAAREDVKIKTERRINDSILMLGAYVLCSIRRRSDTQVPARHFLEENDVDRPAMLSGNRRSEVSIELRHLRSLKGPEPPIRLHLARDAKVAQEEGVIPLGVVVIKEHGVVYLRHKQWRVCSACRRRRRHRPFMRAAALNMGGPDVGDAASAGVESLIESDGHGWWSGGESDALGDRLIVALAELGSGGWAVFVYTACAGWRGG